MYYAQNTMTDSEMSFNSLEKAVAYAVRLHDTHILIHNGWFNFDYYEDHDTVETLLARCKAIEETL